MFIVSITTAGVDGVISININTTNTVGDGRITAGVGKLITDTFN